MFTVYDAIRCNLSAYGGPADGAVADTLFQEIDLRTGLVRYEWHALDHVALADSYQPVGDGGTPVSPWDYFHINAVSEHGSSMLVDTRNTWAAYDVIGEHRADPVAPGRQGIELRDGARRKPGLAARRPRRARRHDLVLRQRRHAEGAFPVARDRASRSTNSR